MIELGRLLHDCRWPIVVDLKVVDDDSLDPHKPNRS